MGGNDETTQAQQLGDPFKGVFFLSTSSLTRGGRSRVSAASLSHNGRCYN